MEVVSAGVVGGDVLPSAPPSFSPPSSGLQIQHSRQEEEEEDDEEDEEEEEITQMETEQGGPGYTSPVEEMECEDDTRGESAPNPAPEFCRRNKRKNFMPRNIIYTYQEEDEGETGGESSSEAPLDLSDAPRKDTRTETLDDPALEMQRYAEQTMRRLLGLYGLPGALPGALPPSAAEALYSGSLLESLNAAEASRDGSEGGPTPPVTPHRENISSGAEVMVTPPLDTLHQHAFQARMLGGGNFSTLLTLAALQEGQGASGVPIPPTLEAHQSLPPAPSTPTSIGVTPGLAGLSLGSGGGTPSSLVGGSLVSKSPIDYTRYVKRFSSALECGSAACRELNHREHFHCLDCDAKIFSKKEEMIRHFKWHKKRDESLQHGFMRYSPTDNCSDRFSNCSHNHKQTHYHCLKDGCDKVYISTSDVQMHANYHRKDSAIMQEGFQRFRTSEDCSTITCPYAGQRTTHFHCMRTGCNYTFKNKADMEKHKTYHIKDEQLSKDGFKKFLKQEECPYDGCKFSRVINHIHCIRQDCNYVLHSSGQTFAHKRKHERQDHERAYRKYKLAQSMLGVPEPHPAFNPLLHEALRPLGGLTRSVMSSLGDPVRDDDDGSSSPVCMNGSANCSLLASQSLPRRGHHFLLGGFPPPGVSDGHPHPLARLLAVTPPAAHSFYPGIGTTHVPTSGSSSPNPASPVDLSLGVSNGDDREWDQYIRHCTRDEVCHECQYSGEEHWHCEECSASFKDRVSALEHGQYHEQQEIITEEHYSFVEAGDDPRSCPPDCLVQGQATHYHCLWDGCGEVILAVSEKPFRRLEHFKIHDYNRKLQMGAIQGGLGVSAVTSVDAMFKRKRGRPPKNRIIELPVSSSSHDTPQAIFTSFKLPKSSPPPSNSSLHQGLPIIPHPALTPLGHLVHLGRELPLNSHLNQSPIGVLQPDVNSMLLSGEANVAVVTRTNVAPVMFPANEPVASNPLQPQADVIDGFYVYNEGGLCPDHLCPHLGRRHFHCTHPRCLYVTTNNEVLSLHSRDFHENTPIPEGFLAIDRNIDCRLPSCQSNKVNKHFHCVRCNYSFVRYQTLELHAEKHRQEEAASPPLHVQQSQSPIYLQKQSDNPVGSPVASSQDTPTKSQVVKSSGIFYPLSPFPNDQPASHRTHTSRSEPGALVTPIPPPSKSQITLPNFTLPVTACLTITASRKSPIPTAFSSSSSFEKMYQDDSDIIRDCSTNSRTSLSPNKSEEESPQHLVSKDEKSPFNSNWLLPDHHPQYGPEHSCGRPFCKLKKKEHFHCQICNQAFSEQEKLRPHLLKHASSPSTLDCAPVMEEDSMQDSSRDEDPVSQSDITEQPYSPHSPESSGSSTANSVYVTSTSSPRISGTVNISLPHPPPQFPSPLVYSQAPGLHGLSPFGHHLSMAGIFPGGLPRLMPHSAWPGVHPALAAMAHPGLMFQGLRPNGEISQNSPTSLPNLSPGLVNTNVTNMVDHSPVLPSSLNTSPHLALLGKRLGQENLANQEAKKLRSSHSIRLLKDEPVPEGYIRFRFNEDCQYPHCGYREHQTHFHCMRKDCGYSFCDKTRFVQHTARHERLDTLMGGDFQQYRSNVPCGRPECAYHSIMGQQQNKASHFHCVKCDFVCTDTNKVVAHRRQHQKRDTINAAGFEKFTPSQPCGMPGCNHNQKQTHYHCLRCQYAVLGLSQMSAHKFRHLE